MTTGTFTTKYSVGDTVFHATIITARKRHDCPDCKGSRKWTAKSPAGTEYEFDCPRCSTSFMNDRDLSLDYSEFVPMATKLTIGSVQYNSAPDHYDSGARYMCRETGVGSGSIYDEARLFETEQEALACAEGLAALSNKDTPWVVEAYNRSLRVCDYQLSNAKIKLAEEASSRAGHMLWNLSDLFSKIEEAVDKDEILEAVEDYKRWDWERDKSKAAADEIEGIRKDLRKIEATS